eukprot:g1825.t1
MVQGRLRLTSEDQCKICEAGRWSNQTGRPTQCTICRAGRWSDQTARVSACTDCPAGKFLADRASSPFLHDSEDLCLVCLGGKYAPSNGTRACKNCPRGKTIKSFEAKDHQSNASCELDCKASEYPSPDRDGCLECDPGYSCDGRSAQTECDPGTYCFQGRKERCPAGRFGEKFAAHNASDGCRNCTPGTYQISKGQTFCTLCGAGRFSSKVAAQTRADCRACAVKGYYCPAGTGNETEHPCEKGTFSNTEAATTCVVCPEGYFQARAGRTNCTGCSAGQFLADQGVSPVYHDEAEDCSVCPANTYADEKGTSQCTTCDTDYIIQDNGGDASKHACPLGKFGKKRGGTSRGDACEGCPVGYKCPRTGMPEPEECGLGAYQDDTGQPDCKPCGYNTYNDNDTNATHQSSCKSCDSDKSTTSLGAKSEIECIDKIFSCPKDSLSYTDNAGYRTAPEASVCAACPIGYRGDGKGTGCALCPRGRFQDTAGKLTCKACDESTAPLCFLSAGSTSSGGALPSSSSPLSSVAAEFPPGFSFLEEVLEKGAKDIVGGESLFPSSSAQSEIVRVAAAGNAAGRSDAGNAAADTQHVLETMPVQTRTALSIAFGVLGLMFFLTHRIWPGGCKRGDLIFAGDHYIEDTHAKRMLDTRLGASFTFMLPCIVGIAVVQIFGAENLLHTKGLEPAVSLNPPLPNLASRAEPAFFKHVQFNIAAFAPTKEVACKDIVAPTTASTRALTCTRTEEDAARLDGADAAFCDITLRCAVSSELRGTSDVHVSFPDAFQNIRWTVTPEAWDGEHIVANISKPLAAQEATRTLSGTAENPTTLSFGAIRTRFRNLVGAKDAATTEYEHGLQLSFLGESIQDSELGSTTNADGMHHVSFRLEVEESVFVSERSDKVGLESRISTVFTMLLTAMSVMRVAKTFLELGIDSLLIRRAERTQSELPADVARRKVILEEKFITTALAGARAEGGGGGGGTGVAAGSSSRA